MRLVHWLVTLPLAVILAIFAVSNRQPAAIGFWPLPGVIEAPLFLIAIAALVLGFLFGELVAWVVGRRWRREARERARRIAALERELAATQARLPGPEPAPQATPGTAVQR